MSLDLAQLREGWDFEAKLAAGCDGRGAVPASFFETYSAMANTDGGTVVLGAAEVAGGSFDVVGLVDVARVEQDLWDQLDNRQKVSANVLKRGDLKVQTSAGRHILVIQVPRAPRHARPVYLNGNPLHAFRRSREGDRRCSEAEVRRMLADASDEPQDSAILPGFTTADLDQGTLDAWRNLFRARQPDHPFLTRDDAGLLTSIGAFRRDRLTGQEGLTVAGLLMFGTERAILDRFAHYQLDYREIVGDDPRERWQDRVTIDGTWPGNVFAFFRRVFPKLTADLKVPFRLDADYKRVDSTPAHEALREALVNALIHADYTGTKGIRVFRRLTSFELVNPGTLRVAWEEARAGNASDPRNPTLQKLFQLVGFGDRAGSGVPRILQAWREQHWRAPQLTEDFEANETRLLLSTESLLPEHALVALDARFGERFRTLPERKRTALVAALVEHRINNRRLQQVIDSHPRDLTVLLVELVRDGLLVPHGERAGRWYTLADPGSAQSIGQSIGQSMGQSIGQSIGQRAIDQVRGGSWAPREEVGHALVESCRDGFHTLADLAHALNRRPASLRDPLRELVRQGALVLRHPASPRHPSQAYQAAPPKGPPYE